MDYTLTQRHPTRTAPGDKHGGDDFHRHSKQPQSAIRGIQSK